jgi:hypothetical protein
MVTAGLPLSSEANETLRSLLFGADAILAGSDADGEDSLLDDVQDLYAFFSGRPEDPPPTNIAPQIATLAAGRVQRLSDPIESATVALRLPKGAMILHDPVSLA